MFECWEHWKEERSWPDMMMSGAPCDAIMCNDLPSFLFLFFPVRMGNQGFFVYRYLIRVLLFKFEFLFYFKLNFLLFFKLFWCFKSKNILIYFKQKTIYIIFSNIKTTKFILKLNGFVSSQALWLVYIYITFTCIFFVLFDWNIW
jgi:hypothetical protein